jgi:hypothetical protein
MPATTIGSMQRCCRRGLLRSAIGVIALPTLA